MARSGHRAADFVVFASRQFRGAVPDLGVEIKKMIVAGDYVTVHIVFTGHFTGMFGQTEGRGQSVSFIASDLLKLEAGSLLTIGTLRTI